MSIIAAHHSPEFRSIPFERLPGFTKSWRAVTSRDSRASELYPRAPAEAKACGQAAEETLRQPRPWQALADIIGDSSRYYGVPNRALDRLDLLAAGKAVMVVTGQQVGYLGGPLYTFVKAYHATRLAAELERQLGLPVLPLFWLEGRDHDLEEVRHASYLNAAGELLTLRFAPEQEIPGYEVGKYPVSAEVHLKELAYGLEFSHEADLSLLGSAYSQTTLADAMGRWLASTLGPRGLLVIEGMDPRLKVLAAPLWEKILSAGSHLTDLFYARTQVLEAAGWDTPMSPTRDAYLFYLTGEHRRASLTYSGQLKHPDGHSETLSATELHNLIRRTPDALSPKAALRPPYQDYLLPTIAYVAGPGEMDYHAQLTPFYREFGITPPSLFPRLSVTILDRKIERQLERAGQTAEEVLATSAHDLSKEAVRRADDGQTSVLFEESRAQIEVIFQRLREKVRAIDPTLAGAAQAAAGRALHPLAQLQEKTERALKQKHATALTRLEKILHALRPRDQLAERVLCSGYYVARYGLKEILAALDELPAVPNEHFVLTLE